MSKPQRGHIFQLNISAGGVPKRAIFHARLGELGLAGDEHADRVHHGGPTRAVCLFSLEQILALQAEGHPIFPGATGENVTTVGIDLAALGPGDRLRLGGQVELEITGFASPCAKIAAAFAEGAFTRIAHKVNPGWSRLYASVVQKGTLAVGQVIERR